MEMSFEINKGIYKVKNINEAIIDFKEVSNIKFNSKLEELLVNWDNKLEIEEIFNEFMNYVISLECS